MTVKDSAFYFILCCSVVECLVQKNSTQRSVPSFSCELLLSWDIVCTLKGMRIPTSNSSLFYVTKNLTLRASTGKLLESNDMSNGYSQDRVP